MNEYGISNAIGKRYAPYKITVFKGRDATSWSETSASDIVICEPNGNVDVSPLRRFPRILPWSNQ